MAISCHDMKSSMIHPTKKKKKVLRTLSENLIMSHETLVRWGLGKQLLIPQNIRKPCTA